ncbi:hypothetical protein ACEPTS_30605 [Pseudomonas aeruginosa]
MSNELTDVRCPCGAEFQADSYDAGFIAGSGMCQNCDAALPPKDICTCPSGDGSLSHPCPAHPAVEQAGGDERAKFEYWASDEGIYPKAVERSGNCYKLAQTQSYWMAWQARAALAEVERLRESKGDPVGSLEKCMKVMYERDEHAKRLEVALARVAEMEKELAMARDAAAKGDAARHAAGGMEMEIQELREKVTELRKELRSRWTYASTQATNCAGCGEHKHTPLRVDWMGGYVCLTCIDKKLEELHDAQAQHSVPELLVRAEDFVSGKEVPQAWLDVQAERRRQITAEGWTPEHDDLYCAAELPRAAAAYILNGANDEAPAIWPFSAKWWKPRDARSNYVRAGALILAEIERLDRAAPGKEGNDD